MEKVYGGKPAIKRSFGLAYQPQIEPEETHLHGIVQEAQLPGIG